MFNGLGSLLRQGQLAPSLKLCLPLVSFTRHPSFHIDLQRSSSRRTYCHNRTKDPDFFPQLLANHTTWLLVKVNVPQDAITMRRRVPGTTRVPWSSKIIDRSSVLRFDAYPCCNALVTLYIFGNINISEHSFEACTITRARFSALTQVRYSIARDMDKEQASNMSDVLRMFERRQHTIV